MAALALYFAHFTLHGDRGLKALGHLRAQVEAKEVALGQIRQQREQLEARVHALQPGSIDGDLLEERARVVLGYTRPDEVLILEEELPQ